MMTTGIGYRTILVVGVVVVMDGASMAVGLYVMLCLALHFSVITL